MHSDVFYIVRHSNERTLAACIACLQCLGNASQIETVSDVPFEATLKRSYIIGSESAYPWVCMVDADVLVNAKRMVHFIDYAKTHSSGGLVFQPYVYDGIFRSYRRGGAKLYRGDVLSLAMTMVPDAGEVMRPESETITRVCKIRNASEVVVPVAVGVHDFAQWPADVYRKGFVHGRKFRRRSLAVVMDELHSGSRSALTSILLHGIIDGIMSDQAYTNDKNLNAAGFHQRFNIFSEELAAQELAELMGRVDDLDASFGKFYGPGRLGELRNMVDLRGFLPAMRAFLSTRVYGYLREKC